MDVERLTAHCLARPGAVADGSWRTAHPVVRVGPDRRAPVFAYLGRTSVGVRVAADHLGAQVWLDRHPDGVRPMAYVGRRGWLDLDLHLLPEDEILTAVEDSYRRAVATLPADERPAGWDVQPEPEVEPEPEPASAVEPEVEEPEVEEPAVEEPTEDEVEDEPEAVDDEEPVAQDGPEPEDEEPEVEQPAVEEPAVEEPADEVEDEPEAVDDEEPAAQDGPEPEDEPSDELDLGLDPPRAS